MLGKSRKRCREWAISITWASLTWEDMDKKSCGHDPLFLLVQSVMFLGFVLIRFGGGFVVDNWLLIRSPSLDLQCKGPATYVSVVCFFLTSVGWYCLLRFLLFFSFVWITSKIQQTQENSFVLGQSPTPFGLWMYYQEFNA